MNYALPIKILVFSYLIYKYGFFYACLITIVRSTLITLLLKYVLGWRLLSALETAFITIPEEYRYTMTAYLVFSEWKPEEVKKVVIEKGIRNFIAMRSRIVKKFGSLVWEEVPFEEAVSTSIKVFEDIQFNSIQEIIDYSIKEQQIPLPIDKALHEFHFIKYKNQMLMFLKFDHAISDGVGFVGMLMAIADNYNIKMFPPLIDIPIIHKIMMNILSPFYFIYHLIISAQISYYKSPFKKEDGLVKGKRIIKIGKKYNFTKVKKISAGLNLSFNDLLSSILIKCMGKEISHYKLENEVKRAICMMPFNLRPIPKSLEELEMYNRIHSHTLSFPMINDVKTEGNKIKKVLDTVLKNIYLGKGVELAQTILINITPEFLYNYLMFSYVKKIDFIMSNVPGPKTKLTYNGVDVEEIMPTPNQGFMNNFLAIVTYNDQFSLTYSTDDKVGIDFDRFFTSLEDELDLIIK